MYIIDIINFREDYENIYLYRFWKFRKLVASKY